jgi:cation-transporting ATPase 13A2
MADDPPSRRNSLAYDPSNRSSLSLFRQASNMSVTSLVPDDLVEMASEEVFSGPLGESLPTSISSFAHRRRRADSIASFAYFEEEEEEEPEQEQGDQNGDVHDNEELNERDIYDYGRDEHSRASLRRKSSAEEPLLSSDDSRRSSSQGGEFHPGTLLLRRMSSSSSTKSRPGHSRSAGRGNQKIYILTEDLTIVIAGFKTSSFGAIVYWFICIVTFGLGYLLLRWLPKWRIRIVGSARALKDAEWMVIENQWGEMSVHDIQSQKYGKPLSSVFGIQEARDYDEDRDPIIQQLKYVDYRYIRLFYNPRRDKFLLGNTWKDPTWTNVMDVRSGLESEEKEYREQVFGKNLIDIEEKTTTQLLIDEVFHPFYIFQVASLVLWSLDEYYYYAACIFIISLVSISTTLIETKATMKRLREVSRFECDVRVSRNGFWRSVESGDLVPGDIYEVSDPSLAQIPCDSLLLSGDCIVNESMLTGESVPVSKTPATDEALKLLSLESAAIHPEVAKHLLFCGTKIIRARRPQTTDRDDEAVALGLVVRTGFNTTKGALIRSMLFPKPSGFKFYRDSFKYISVMGMIAALGFVASFINFIRLGLAWHLIIIRALDLITIVVPPALPATLTIGTNFALQRLKAKKIFCISPQRVNVGGKLDVVCFDKTGTLTEEGLDVLGVHVVQSGKFSNLLSEPNQITNRTVLHTMATCHSLRLVDDELIGDPLDVKMFDFTGWSFEEGSQPSAPAPHIDEEGASSSFQLTPAVARPPKGTEFDLELGILKQFEFVSQLRRASVLVRQLGSPSGNIFVKGAPECMQEICRPETFPSDYEEVLNYYTHRGFRVIACAAKSISKLNWAKVQRMTREEAESGLDFAGFIIFENKLKPITASVINELGKAGIRTVMCTGDNILTAISVARDCELIDAKEHCFVPHFLEGDSRTALSKLIWRSVDNPSLELDESTLKPLPPPYDVDPNLHYDVTNLREYSLAVSGDAFRWIIDFAPERVLKQMLVRGQVFARMSPDEKHELVEKLQSISYSVGFCGDGANDCGALKAADVGISLSEAEASVAAPFTSHVFDISCVPSVIREGRASLVTSFSCFKYMSLYSAIQFTSVSFLYATASNLGDFQFLFIDLFLILPIAIFMGWAGPYPILSRKRPTASLVSRKVLTPLLGQIALCVLFQFIIWAAVQRQPWYQPPILDKDHSNSHNSQNTSLFLLSCYQYILSAIIMSVGPPFRQSMRQNLPFVITMITVLVFSTYMLLAPADWLFTLMELTFMSTGFKVLILFLAGAGVIGGWVGEKWLFIELAKQVGAFKKKAFGFVKVRKEYKVILEADM